MKPAIGQLTALFNRLLEDEVLNSHFEITNPILWQKLGDIDMATKQEFNCYLMFHKRFKLNGLMVKYGFKQKNQKEEKPLDTFIKPFSFAEVERRGAERQQNYSLSKAIGYDKTLLENLKISKNY